VSVVGGPVDLPDRRTRDTVGVTTFAQVLQQRLAHDPGRPLVTFYDDATGEHVELSTTTFANWVAKASSLLADEHGIERGQTLRVDLPPHWLAHVFVAAAWNCGLTVSDAAEPDVVVCGPASVETWAGQAGSILVLACSLRPLGVRFADPLPAGVHDVGVEIWGQPDAFVPWDPATDDDVAVDLAGKTTTQAGIWTAAAAGTLITDGGRLLTVVDPASPPGIPTFTEPLRNGGSVVLATRIERERLEAIAIAERVTARFPPG